MKIAFAGLLITAVITSNAYAKDCSENFPINEYGLSQKEEVISGNTLSVGEYEYIYMVKKSVEVSATDCQYVSTSDVFKLSYIKKPDLLVAGCKGDFDGDSKPDVALILRNKKSSEVWPFVFLNRGDHYSRVKLDKIVAPYGFQRDKHITPGPFCIKRPPSGLLTGPYDPKKYQLDGDLIVIGWQTYFWSKGEMTSSLTTD